MKESVESMAERLANMEEERAALQRAYEEELCERSFRDGAVEALEKEAEALRLAANVLQSLSQGEISKGYRAVAEDCERAAERYRSGDIGKQNGGTHGTKITE